MAGAELGKLFRMVLDDDSAAPDYQKGVEILWDTKREARHGRLVMVKDQFGQIHIRRHKQSLQPNQWTAAAINPDYISIDSDKLTLVAVFKGLMEPDD